MSVIPSGSLGIPTVGGNHYCHSQTPFPVIPSGSRGIPTVGGNRHSHSQFPLRCHSERQPRNPNRRGEAPLPFPVPPSLSFRAAVEESKSHSARGLPLGMTLAPHRWDSSAAARNDRVRCLGVGLLVESHRWDSSAAARNDRQRGAGPWYDGSLPTFWIPRKGSEWQGMGMQHSLQATAIPQTTVMSSIEKKGLSQSGSGSPVRRRV